MSLPAKTEKRCSTCGETKPWSEFYRHTKNRDNLSYSCKPCMRAYAKAYKERKRQEVGEEVFLETQRDVTRRSRERTGNVAGRKSASAYDAALYALRDAHRAEFDALLRRERYDRGLPIKED